tara:strand:- start:747 stop:980 length:234 start_codon:yes stop_codon:yes gene_type:complete
MPVVKKQEDGMDEVEYKLAENLIEGDQVMIAGSKGYVTKPIVKITKEILEAGASNIVVSGNPIARRTSSKNAMNKDE